MSSATLIFADKNFDDGRNYDVARCVSRIFADRLSEAAGLVCMFSKAEHSMTISQTFKNRKSQTSYLGTV